MKSKPRYAVMELTKGALKWRLKSSEPDGSLVYYNEPFALALAKAKMKLVPDKVFVVVKVVVELEWIKAMEQRVEMPLTDLMKGD